MSNEGLIEHEEWRTLTLFGRKYAVSNLARFKRLEQDIVRSDGVKLHYKERLVKPTMNGQGRADVHIDKKTLRLAHLVALAFIGERPEKHVVSHRDGDCKNDRAYNLEYISNARNILNTADKIRADNSTGIRGVHYDETGCSPIWRGRIVIDGKSYTKASKNKEDVVAWRKLMEITHNTDRRTA